MVFCYSSLDRRTHQFRFLRLFGLFVLTKKISEWTPFMLSLQFDPNSLKMSNPVEIKKKIKKF